MYTKSLTLGLSLYIQGGFAKVFAGTLAGPHRAQYAIKIVAKCSLQKPRAQQKVQILIMNMFTSLFNFPFQLCALQLQTEIKIHKALRHVNVVKFERVFDDASFYYIVMELCDYNVRPACSQYASLLIINIDR